MAEVTDRIIPVTIATICAAGLVLVGIAVGRLLRRLDEAVLVP
ncbi:MAG: hypothetical protein ACT443_15115 [Gemmatimonadota bacterium]